MEEPAAFLVAQVCHAENLPPPALAHWESHSAHSSRLAPLRPTTSGADTRSSEEIGRKPQAHRAGEPLVGILSRAKTQRIVHRHAPRNRCLAGFPARSQSHLLRPPV